MQHLLLDVLQPQTIVVFRALQLGDMLCAVPALRALRAACPHARITLVGLPWAAAFATRYPRHVDDFVAFPGFPGLPEQPPDSAALPGFLAAMRARRAGLAIQMHGNGTITNPLVAQFGARFNAGFGAPGSGDGAFLPYPDDGAEIRRLLALMRFLGAPPVGEQLEFPLTAADHAELAASGVAAGLRPNAYVCLHAGARAVERRWPPERFAAIGDALHDDCGLPLVLTGSQYETSITAAVTAAMRAPAIDAAAPISAGALAALLGGARLLVCNDTGVAHLAAALKLPCVIVFRASEIARWAPLDRALHRPVWAPAARDDGVQHGGDEDLTEVLAQARALLAMPARHATVPAPAP
ncbi:glycosyltransferase family 9 protein [Aromatoleum aromaticum]|uniref:glycosyltransferase family 9 protein n=1 Tax=Aromatoleum aromaticum TaxID=551760 RepID=UPI0005A1D17F|nr:glycosyltransferase family 9 protein [Aromatoleum aromaticum]